MMMLIRLVEVFGFSKQVIRTKIRRVIKVLFAVCVLSVSLTVSIQRRSKAPTEKCPDNFERNVHRLFADGQDEVSQQLETNRIFHCAAQKDATAAAVTTLIVATATAACESSGGAKWRGGRRGRRR